MDNHVNQNQVYVFKEISKVYAAEKFVLSEKISSGVLYFIRSYTQGSMTGTAQKASKYGFP